jgi:RNA polymerase sigma-70 factor (ECF subfamily)
VSERNPEPNFEALFRAEWGRLVATAIRMLGDIDRAEEIAQESWVAAMEHWPKSGLPDRPGAWLMTTVRNRAVDELRRRQRDRAKHAEIAALASSEGSDLEREMKRDLDAAESGDDRLTGVHLLPPPAVG